jgi:hypothetical protein
MPLAMGALFCGSASLAFVLLAEKGRLFQQHHVAGGTSAVDGGHIESLGVH